MFRADYSGWRANPG